MNSQPRYTHFVELHPLGSFFFGGERFSDKKDKTFYFQKSNLFPQPSTILGMLRYQLLAQNNGLSQHGNFANEARAIMQVGEEGFNPESTGNTYGMIKQISPILIFKDNQAYAPFSKVKYFKDDEHEASEHYSLATPTISTLTNGKSMYNNTTTIPILLDQYNPKHGTENGYRAIDGTDFFPHDKVYDVNIKDKIGIYKTDTLPHRQTADADREGFFKQTFQQLNNGFTFGFYVQLNLTDSTIFESRNLIYLGKERSAFSMNVRPVDTLKSLPFLTVSDDLEKGDLIWLAADARLDMEQVYQKATGVLTQDNSFRCLISRIGNGINYFEKPKSTNDFKKMRLSARYNLLKKGSLLYVQDPSIKKLLFNYPAWEKIGFNHFIKL